MDGRGRCHDNIFVERLWWTVKHEWVYLRPAADGIEQKRSLGEFFDWYNLRRPHQPLGWRTPDEACDGPGCFGQLPGRDKLKAGSRLLVSPFPEIKFILSCCGVL